MSNRKIIIADDDLDDIEVLVDSVRKYSEEFSVEVFSNGQEVVEYMAGCSSPDFIFFILLDYNLPILNAAEVLEKLRSYLHLNPIPKMVWSTSTASDHMQKCLEAGALKYYAKPGTTDELNEISSQLAQLLSRKPINHETRLGNQP